VAGDGISDMHKIYPQRRRRIEGEMDYMRVEQN
jgi:hypothetical protein